MVPYTERLDLLRSLMIDQAISVKTYEALSQSVKGNPNGPLRNLIFQIFVDEGKDFDLDSVLDRIQVLKDSTEAIDIIRSEALLKATYHILSSGQVKLQSLQEKQLAILEKFTSFPSLKIDCISCPY